MCNDDCSSFATPPPAAYNFLLLLNLLFYDCVFGSFYVFFLFLLLLPVLTIVLFQTFPQTVWSYLLSLVANKSQ